jgi:hypothetical protein
MLYLSFLPNLCNTCQVQCLGTPAYNSTAKSQSFLSQAGSVQRSGFSGLETFSAKGRYPLCPDSAQDGSHAIKQGGYGGATNLKTKEVNFYDLLVLSLYSITSQELKSSSAPLHSLNCPLHHNIQTAATLSAYCYSLNISILLQSRLFRPLKII